MSVTCEICLGAIPSGEPLGGHTALCAGVVGEQLGVAVAALHLIAGTHGAEVANPREKAAQALRTIDGIVSPGQSRTTGKE
jgi:hypothetical protein